MLSHKCHKLKLADHVTLSTIQSFTLWGLLTWTSQGYWPGVDRCLRRLPSRIIYILTMHAKSYIMYNIFGILFLVSLQLYSFVQITCYKRSYIYTYRTALFFQVLGNSVKLILQLSYLVFFHIQFWKPHVCTFIRWLLV